MTILSGAIDLVRGLGLTRLARSTASLSLGTLVSQVVGLATTPILTRLYSAHDFGLLSLVLSAAALLAPIACLRLDLSIPIPRTQQMATALLQSGALCTLIVALAITGTACAFLALGTTLPSIGAPLYLVYLGVMVATSSATLLLNGWLTRLTRFRAIAINLGLLSVITAASQITFAAGGSSPHSLILGLLLGQIVSVGYLCWAGVANLPRRVRTSRLSRLRLALFAYRRFYIWSTPGSVFNAASLQLAPLAALFLFGPEATGLLYLANRIVTVPLYLVASTLLRVMVSETTRLVSKEPARLFTLFKMTSLSAFALSAPGLALFFVGSDLVGLMFGAAWRPAGQLAAILYVNVWFGILAGSCSNLSLLGHNKSETLWEVARFISLGGVAASAFFTHPTITVFAIEISACFSLFYLVLFAMNWRAYGRLAKVGKRLGSGISDGLSDTDAH